MALCLCVPITSKSKSNADECLTNLIQNCRYFPHSTEIILAIDKDDKLLAHHEAAWFAGHLKLKCVVMLVEPSRPPPLVQWYNEMLRMAAKCDNLEYFVLWGDDIKVVDKEARLEKWFDAVKNSFMRYHKETGLPFGFGCVALNDMSSPGFPTFPVVHRTHLNIFKGFCRSVFYNQDADPWVFQLYRRWGVACIESSLVIENQVGGALSEPRYQRQHVNWKDEVLIEAISTVQDYLKEVENKKQYSIGTTIDVVIPTFRTNVPLLEQMFRMKIPKNCSVFFIVVVDDPNTKQRSKLENLEKQFLGKVRVRFQQENSGASLARNRGLDESAAEWILFLDDDVQVSENLLESYVDLIAIHGEHVCGFVGKSSFPSPNTSRQAGFVMSYLSYFWDVSTRMQNPPWGVTANLLVRRTSVRFHSDFVKTGGGEDIAMCIDTAEITGQKFCAAPEAQILHPWWQSGNFSPWRFFNWTQGDGLLIDKYPKFSYVNFPNVIELSALCIALMSFSAFVFKSIPLWQTCWFLYLWFMEFTCDAIHLMTNDRSTASSYTTDTLLRLKCAIISTYFKNFVELGHFWVHAKRGKIQNLCTRFDWYCGQVPGIRAVERIKGFSRCVIFFLYLLPFTQASSAALCVVCLTTFAFLDRSF